MKQPLAYADWTGAEYRALAGCVLTGRLHHGHQVGRLQAHLAELYRPSLPFVLNYAHHGIAVALRLFRARRPERSEVILPVYICPSVPQAIEAEGLRVRYVDVQPDLNLSVQGVAQALGPMTLAVIAPHMFGCPAPIAEIEALCRDAGVFLMDDAAQVAGVHAQGRLLGTFGDMGVLSFAQSKTVVTGIRGSGGVLLVNQPLWADGAARWCASLPPSAGRSGPLADFLWNYMGGAWTGHSGYYVERLRAALGLQGQADAAGPTQMGNAEAAVALVQFDRLQDLLAAKREVVAWYAEGVKAQPDLAFPQHTPGGYLARVMLQLPEGVDVSLVRQRLAGQGIETRLGYAVPADQARAFPMAWAQSQRLLGVPTRAGMSRAEVLAICQATGQACITSDRTSR
jgi:perosamine synthetase